ncbi:hypothetical protein C6A37_10805, partial [Desulfobacteraceae bacterium SEEP-SAG9]
LCHEKRRQEHRIQNKVFAFGSTGKYKMCIREATTLYSDFWLLNSVFQRRLSLKALSKGKPNPGPLGQDSLLFSYIPIALIVAYQLVPVGPRYHPVIFSIRPKLNVKGA